MADETTTTTGQAEELAAPAEKQAEALDKSVRIAGVPEWLLADFDAAANATVGSRRQAFPSLIESPRFGLEEWAQEIVDCALSGAAIQGRSNIDGAKLVQVHISEPAKEALALASAKLGGDIESNIAGWLVFHFSSWRRKGSRREQLAAAINVGTAYGKRRREEQQRLAG